MWHQYVQSSPRSVLVLVRTFWFCQKVLVEALIEVLVGVSVKYKIELGLSAKNKRSYKYKRVPKGARHLPLRWCLATTRRILFHHLQGKYKAPTIAKLLRKEGLSASRQSVAEVLKRYESRGTIKRKPGSGRPSRSDSRS